MAVPVNSQPQNTRIFPRTPHNYPPIRPRTANYAVLRPCHTIPVRVIRPVRSATGTTPAVSLLPLSLVLSSSSLPKLCLSFWVSFFFSFLPYTFKCSTRDYIPFYILYFPPSSFLLFLFVYSLCSCACSYNPRILFHLAHHPTTFPPFPPLLVLCDLAPLSLSLSFRPLTDTPLKNTEYLTTIIVISTVSKRTED